MALDYQEVGAWIASLIRGVAYRCGYARKEHTHQLTFDVIGSLQQASMDAARVMGRQGHGVSLQWYLPFEHECGPELRVIVGEVPPPDQAKPWHRGDARRLRRWRMSLGYTCAQAERVLLCPVGAVERWETMAGEPDPQTTRELREMFCGTV